MSKRRRVSSYRGDDNLRFILDKVLKGPLEAVPFFQSSPGDFFQACLIWLLESGARAKGKASVIDPPEFYYLTEMLLVYADRQHIEVSPLWDFYCDSTENPLDPAEDHRRKEGLLEFGKSFQRTDMCITRLQFDCQSRADQSAGMRLTETEQEFVDVLREAGHRLTSMQILGWLASKGKVGSEGTAKIYLSGLVRRRILNNRRDVRPPGYGLPEWEQ